MPKLIQVKGWVDWDDLQLILEIVSAFLCLGGPDLLLKGAYRR